ncbi:MAG: hypothetical protein AB7Y46_21000 [Armatimonadota bacterium]
MRTLVLIAAAAGLVAGAACAGPFCDPSDGNLNEWQIDFTTWESAAPLVASYTIGADDYVTGDGGEWYDIEALFLRAETDTDGTQYLNWAFITSYGGVEPGMYAALPSGIGEVWELRNGKHKPSGQSVQLLDYPYRRHPVLALRFLSGGQSTGPWTHGIIMAPNHDWQYADTGTAFPTGTVSFANSHGLSEHPSENQNYQQYQSGADAAGATSTIDDTPQLWYVDPSGAGWRDGHPNEFGTGTYHPSTHNPIDFNVATGGPNTQLASDGSVHAGNTREFYDETAFLNRTWSQDDNWFWEGYVTLPKTGLGGIDLSNVTRIDFFNGLWCSNNKTFGDSTCYAGPPPPPPGNDAPEPCTWVLLVCTGVLGGAIRRWRAH